MPTTGDWFALAAEQKRYQAKRMAVYAAMVEAMDEGVGHVLAALDESGQAENTIVVFFSDNGGLSTLSLIHISSPRDQRGSRMPSSA